MIDFNDSSLPAEHNREAEREAIRAELIARLESVLVTMFPAGKKRGHKFMIGDVLGSPGDSLEVVLDGDKAGLWTDRANNSGGDVFALIGECYGINVHSDFPRVLEQAADLLGFARSVPMRKTRKEAPVDELGPATAKWDYVDAAGRLLAVVYRYDPPGRKKEFRPWDAQRRKMAPPESRPLFNQPGLVASKLVVLVEGEKCAQALIELGIAATTAMHGASAPVDKTDWRPLAGKSVLIWPDRDAPGWDYADRASQAILQAGASNVAILVPSDDKPEGWDAADAIPEGFDVAGFLAVGERMPVTRPLEEVAPPEARTGAPRTVCRVPSPIASVRTGATARCGASGWCGQVCAGMPIRSCTLRTLPGAFAVRHRSRLRARVSKPSWPAHRPSRRSRRSRAPIPSTPPPPRNGTPTSGR